MLVSWAFLNWNMDVNFFKKKGEWEHFLYVGKIAFYGWAFHFSEFKLQPYAAVTLFIVFSPVPFSIMGRVTYLHHYICFLTCMCVCCSLQTWFFFLFLPSYRHSISLLSHVLDHFIFSSRQYTKKTKNIIFCVLALVVVFNFWWFKGVVFGIHGPIEEHKGLQWRQVCDLSFHFFLFYNLVWKLSSRGIYIIEDSESRQFAKGCVFDNSHKLYLLSPLLYMILSSPLKRRVLANSMWRSSKQMFLMWRRFSHYLITSVYTLRLGPILSRREPAVACKQ